MRILYFQCPEPLQALSEACLSLTPKVFISHNREVFLDIAVTESYFGGEHTIMERWKELTQTFQVAGQTVLTDRPQWARPFAIGNKEIQLPRGQSQQHLFALPLERLPYCGEPELSDEVVAEHSDLVGFMKRIGMQQIFDFARLGPTAVGRRFGQIGMQLHQYVLGTRTPLLPQWAPDCPLEEAIATDDIGSLDALCFSLRQLLVKLEARLRGRAQLVSQLKLSFSLESGRELTHTLTLAEPTQESAQLQRLLKEQLTQLSWDSPLTHLKVGVTETTPFQAGQLSLFDRAMNKMSDLGNFVERLRSRYGRDQAGVAHFEASHLPERSWRPTWPATGSTLPERAVPFGRPLFLYDPPRPYHLRGNQPLVSSENLAVEWWDKEPGFRRYYLTKDHQGRRLWIYWDAQKSEWYLHGTFD